MNKSVTPLNSLLDEIGFLFSGRGMPYEKVCMTVAMIISIFLSVLMGGNFAKDAPVAIIDLDNSRYSHELASRIDASEYMRVTDVINSPMNVDELFYRDSAVAVVYFPRDLEKNRFNGSDGAIGIFYDNTNTAQTADVKEAMNELIAIDNAMNATGSGGAISLNTRNLFNPAGSTSNAQTQGFLFFFGAMFFVFATIGMVPRLRMTHQLDRILIEGTPWDLIVRIIPYAFCLITSFFVGLAILRIWGDLVFSGTMIEFLLVQILFAMTVGMLSLLFGWTAANPGIASSRMILFIPGGFILGGVTSPLSHLQPWVVAFSHIFPLTWEFHFTRDIIQRGAHLTEISSELGAFFIYIAIVAILLSARFYHDRKKIVSTVKAEAIKHLETPVEKTWQDINVEKILVPTDGSGQAFKAVNQAIHFAAVCDAKITLLMCVEIDQEVAAFEQVSMGGYVPNELKAAALQFLTELIRVIPKEIDVEMRVEIGAPSEVICQMAAQENFDMIVMSSQGFGSVATEEKIGHVSSHVMGNAPCPVIIVKGMPDDWHDEENYIDIGVQT